MGTRPARFLMIDNYDSFTYNLVQLFWGLGVEVVVRRHDKVGLDDIASLAPDAICISPGPKAPGQAGVSKAVVSRFAGRIPMLGVCLGMQVMNEVLGGVTVRAPVPVHGKRSPVRHHGRGLFEGIPSPFLAARYHSLCVEVRSEDIEVSARSEDGVIMAIEHRHLPIWGVQFHPESFMTEHGRRLVANFLTMARACSGGAHGASR